MPELDGKATHKDFVVPFDAHDRVLRESPSVHTLNEKKDPVPMYEYPKAVAHDKETGEPLVARDAAHEAELLEQLEEEKT